MNHPGHLADAARETRALPTIDGLDLTVAATNVRRDGGDPATFATALAAALDTDPRAGVERVVAFAAVSAWRAGALAYREEALRRIDNLVASGRGEQVARLLGLATASEVSVFVKEQHADRFWWPGRRDARGYVCAVGGFAGLGGTWTAPPTEAYALPEPGAFAIRTADQWWRLDADVWGSRLAPMDLRAKPAPSATATTIVVTEDSYLAWVHVQEAA